MPRPLNEIRRDDRSLPKCKAVRVNPLAVKSTISRSRYGGIARMMEPAISRQIASCPTEARKTQAIRIAGLSLETHRKRGAGRRRGFSVGYGSGMAARLSAKNDHKHDCEQNDRPTHR